LYAAFILVGVLGTFKAYLTLADPGLFLSMIVLFPETFPRSWLTMFDTVESIDLLISRPCQSNRYDTPASARLIAPSTFPPSVAYDWDRKCQFLLRIDIGFCVFQWSRADGLHLGWIENSFGGKGRVPYRSRVM
jgi:hypothetical protein